MAQFDYRKSVSYFRDKFVNFSEANVSIASSPVLYGLSVYTVFSLSWNDNEKKLYVFRLKDHFNRLVNSARIMDFHSFADHWTYEKFESVMLDLIKRNNIKEDVLVRVTVFIDELAAGTKIHGLKNSLSAYIYPMGEILPLSGINLGVSSWVRNSDNSIPAKAKINGSYVNASLMKNEALLNGYDDAIALDHNGHVAESTVANLFIVRGGKLATPDTSTDILEGITRDSLLEVARKDGLTVEERSIDRTELYKSDEAFLCGTSARITPVLSIDKRPIGSGKIGPLTKKLMKKYEAIQRGNAPDFADWRQAL
ncbi:MAG TPA: branched-chain-amino-acid transaminase [Patescibacteria group bacterium]|nr:branched-chain-amino-acid transaminase [Patescibacteria group bacterium]